MKILHVVTLVDDHSSYGGPLTVAINQCIELRRRGHDARIVAGWRGVGDSPKLLEGVPAHLFPVRRLIPIGRFSGLVSLAMMNWLRAEAHSADAGHIHLARDLMPLAAAHILANAGVPYVTQTHGMVTGDRRLLAHALDALFTRRALRRAATRFVLTQRESDDIADLLTDSPTTTLRNGVRMPEASPPNPGLSLDVLFMARLHPRKNVMHFAEAARRLIVGGTDATFSIVGPDDGDLRTLEVFIASHPELLGRLEYEGALAHSDALRRLSRADIYVLPSVDEPFPMTLLEALALGKPAICTSSCGISTDLDATGAVLVTESGVPALTSTLGLLLADPELRRRTARRALVAIADRFSMTAVGDVLVDHYAETVRVVA